MSRAWRMLTRLLVVGAIVAVLPATSAAQSEGETAPAPDEQERSASEDARALFEQGAEAYEQGRFAEALTLFERAFEATTPERRIYILYNIGLCHDQLGHVEEAIEHFEQYLRLVPEGPRHQWVRGRIRVLRERQAAARTAEQRAEERASAEPLRQVPPPPERQDGSPWWPWAVAGGVVLAGGVALAVFLLSGDGEGEGYTFGRFEALR